MNTRNDENNERMVSGMVVRQQAQSILQALIDAGLTVEDAEKYVLLGLADAKRDGLNMARLTYGARTCDVCERVKEHTSRGMHSSTGEATVCDDCREKAKQNYLRGVS